MWLVAGQRLPQALVMLHNCLELAFKAELEGIHPSLIAKVDRWRYEDLKAILREEFLSHPKGAEISLPDFDFDKTITFTEAMKRVANLYKPLLAF